MNQTVLDIKELKKNHSNDEIIKLLLDLMTSQERKRYQSNGYVSFDYVNSFGCDLIVLIGPRGTGKTYTIIKELRDEPIIYMRRTAKQMELCACEIDNPYKALNRDLNINIKPFKTNDIVTFNYCDKDGEPERLAAVGLALSTFFNLRGVSFDDYETLFFDEIIPEPLERVRKGEGKAFLNAIETTNRNRELQGRKPIKLILAGNSDTLNSQILSSVGVVDYIERMKRKGQKEMILKDKSIAIFDLSDSPISALKSDTFLYKIANDKSFINVALKNSFDDLEGSKDIKSCPLGEFFAVYNLNDEIGAYVHKSDEYWYICKRVPKNGLFFNINTKEGFVKFRKVGIALRRAAIDGDVYFDSFDTKNKFYNDVFLT